MPEFARVLLDRSFERPLDYAVPEALLGKVAPGSRVRAPLRTRSVLGTVLAVLDSTDARGVKPLEGLVNERPLITSPLLKLAAWMAEYYCCPEEVALRCVLPQVVRDAETGPRQLRGVELTGGLDEEEILRLAARAPRQAEVARALIEAGRALAVADLCSRLSLSPAAVEGLVRRGAARFVRMEVARDPHGGETFLAAPAPSLNAEQETAFAALRGCLAAPPPVPPLLLHGVTGSGKTEIYLRGIEAVLEMGRTALVLVPEIALTPQTVERFKSRFSAIQGEVAVLHSHLSAGERYDEWFKIREGRARIAIGARSAVFAPLDKLGLVVVDEEHEPSYKQEEAPRYHARDVAVMRARLEGAAVLLGSATPCLESFHNARSGKYRMVRLTERADDRRMPIIRILDMRVQRRKAGPDSILAAPLSNAVAERLQRGEQTILFLNRRGFSTSLVCGACGHVCRCPHCSIALTYHRQEERIVCHLCGHAARAPHDCPECSAPGIRYAGVGTQKVEQAVRSLFPDARVARMDADTMTRKNAYREALGAFRTGKTDILVGTQMIAKGLHFPNVTLVGIINADLGLHLPDFRAGERTFQLLTQVAGRAGRGEMEGEVMVQTFTPFSPSIQFARHHDFDGFFEQESEFRRKFHFPPYWRFMLLTLRSPKKELGEFTLCTIARKLAEDAPEGLLLGEPAPAPLEKIKDAHRFHLTLRSQHPLRMTAHVRQVLARLPLPKEVHLAVDMDAQFLL